MIDTRSLKKKLMQGSLNEVIDLLDDFLYDYDKETHNYLIILSSKYSQISRRQNLGTVNYETFQMVSSQIQLAILEDLIPKTEALIKIKNNQKSIEELKLLEKKRQEVKNIEEKLSLTDDSTILITEESLKEYLKKKFQDLPFKSFDNHFEEIFPLIDTKKYKYTRDLDLIFSLTKKARAQYKRHDYNSQLAQLDLALACLDSEYRHRHSDWSGDAKNVFNNFITNKEFCSFCGGNKKDKLLLIAGISGYICETCSEEAMKIVKQELNY